MKIVSAIACMIFLFGCDVARNNPMQQVEDFNTCMKAGMKAYSNSYGEVKCKP